jgi:hypothetical protein
VLLGLHADNPITELRQLQADSDSHRQPAGGTRIGGLHSDKQDGYVLPHSETLPGRRALPHQNAPGVDITYCPPPHEIAAAQAALARARAIMEQRLLGKGCRMVPAT